MSIAFTVVGLVLVTFGIPRTGIRLFQEPVPARSSHPIALPPRPVAIRIPRRRDPRTCS
jgi:hypothetical protein